MSFLEITDLRKSFGQSVAVETFSLTVARGEFVSFLGPSGCGKTTTMRMIAGFEEPDHGAIMLDGVDLLRIPANKRRVGMVFQSYALFPHLTVEDNITFGMSLAGANKDAMRTRATALLELIQLPGLGGRYPSQLSGGQQQRVALARALAIQPRVLLLDEPLSALDAKIRDELRIEIRRIQRELGITAIYVTHDQSEALALSDRVVVMNAGRVEQIGTPFEIYNRPANAFVARFVGAQSMLTGRLSGARDAVETRVGLIRLPAQLTSSKPGDAVSIMLRPELLRFGRDDARHNALPGAVQQVTFLGSVVRTHVTIDEQVIAVDQLNHPKMSPFSVGEAVTVSFAPEACVVV
jgi:putative spermidine/putrescine transport system ATP-binding protein